MDNFGQMQDALQSDLNIDDNSTFFSLTAVKLAINRAKRKAEALFRWPGLEDAKKTSTQVNQEYYDYPDDWRPDSIWKLWIDSDDNDYGDPLAFRDYLYEKENDEPAGKTYYWANQWKRFFVQPTPTTNGSNNMKIWGLKASVDMEADNDTTIFSNSIPECNEAIVLEAKAILKAKADQQSSGSFFSAEAKAILTTTWTKIKQEQAKFEKTQVMFDVPDYFGKPRTADKIGNF